MKVALAVVLIVSLAHADERVSTRIPSGATAIVATTTGTGTVYTAVTKRRLHITSLSISAVSNGIGTLQFNVTPENGVAGQPLAVQLGAAGGLANISIAPIDIPTTTNVVTAATGVAASSSFSLVGWEESTER